MCYEARTEYRRAHASGDQEKMQETAKMLHMAVMEYYERLLPYLRDEHLKTEVVNYQHAGVELSIQLEDLQDIDKWQYGFERQEKEVDPEGPYKPPERETETYPSTVSATVSTSLIRELDRISNELEIGADVQETPNETGVTQDDIKEYEKRVKEVKND